MIQKEIIDLIVSRTKIDKRDLIEKDLILHRLLIGLSSDKYFFNNYAFKGGTCLTKCYFGYYRFSEDLDFTYINQDEFNGKSEKQKRYLISDKINEVLELLENVAKDIGLDFKKSKDNLRYVELGGSNKQTTFKLWYVPDGSVHESFIKIQINFLEILEYTLVEKNCDNLVFGKIKDFNSAFLLPEKSEWVLKTPKIKCYNIKEILIEKVRAILTRRGTKARDYVDVYMIEKKEKLNVADFKSQIIKKIDEVIKFEKYKNNLIEKQANDFSFSRNEEERILLIALPKDFDKFFGKLKEFLKELSKEL